MHSRGISYVNNILISLCPNILDTLSIDTPSARVICEAKVWRAMWKVSRFGMWQSAAIFLRWILTVSQPGIGRR